MNFTAHNVLLPDGQTTIAGQPRLCDLDICKAPLRTLNAIWRPEQRSKVRVVDLGCLEGGYAIEFARHGYDVLGIEARESNLERCRWLASKLNLPNLRFEQDDVRNLKKHGQFEAAFCSGLLYHLDAPIAFLNLIGEVTTTVTLVHTHYATGPLRPSQRALSRLVRNPTGLPMRLRRILDRKVLRPTKIEHHLSAMQQNEGRWGRWFSEFDQGTAKEVVDKNLPWAAVGNHRSFWLHKQELLQAIRAAGFDLIYEQYDFLDDIVTDTYIQDQDRSLFVGLKSAAMPGSQR